jgi:DNA-directed RNA polymerase II subunit RPB1
MADVSKHHIDHIQFGLSTCEQIRRSAVIEITDTALHQKDKRPSDYGLFSRFLGATQVHRCMTCGLGPAKCSGHFGCIELGTWVYHPDFIDDIVHILNHVCYFCAASLSKPGSKASLLSKSRSKSSVMEEDLGATSTDKTVVVEGEDSNSPLCACCGLPNPLTYTKDHGVHIQPVWHSKTKFPDQQTKGESCALFRPERALHILSGIDDDTYALLGYADLKYTHPKSYVVDVIPVSSLASRSVTTRGRGASSSSRSLDDLTTLYQLILNSVIDLKKHRALIAQREALGDNLAEIRRLKLNKEKVDRARYLAKRIPEDIQVRISMLFVKDLRAQTAKSRKLYSKTGGPPTGMQIHGASRSSQPAASFSSINDRITGNNKKRALVRGNLMGKRLEYTARSVITPDPTLKINELGVPLSIAMDQTFKETVTRDNIRWLYALVLTGPDVHPGAVAVWKLKRRPGTSSQPGGYTESLENREKICLRQTTTQYRATRIRLRIGDIVERHMMDGDLVLFNRQPSLHKNSFMAHFAKVVKGLTFQLPPGDCKSYNADFDGDEMNLHFPQTQDARSDALNLLLVDHNICTPQTGFPVVTIIQDMVDVMFRIGTMDTLVTRSLMCDMMCGIALEDDLDMRLDEPAIRVKPGLKPTGSTHSKGVCPDSAFQPIWTGAQLASKLFPTCLNLVHRKKSILISRNDWKDPILDGEETHIRHGRFCSGWLTKSVVNNVTEILFKTCGSRLCTVTNLSEAGKYLTRVSRLAFHYSARVPSTIGVRDVSIQDPALQQEIKLITSKAVAIISKNADQLTEFEIGRLCQRVIKYVGDAIVKSQPKNCTQMSNLMRAVISGARGSLVNVVQIMGCLGQQHVEGQRIGVYGPEGRTLPFFPRNTPKSNLIARGLIAFCCFMTGLTPKEFIFHMQGGREGIISTAIKTAQSGYITRRLTTVLKASIKFGFVMLGTWFFAHRYYGDGLDASRLTLCMAPELLDVSAKLIQRYFLVMPVNILDQLVCHHAAIASVKGRTIAWNDTTPQLALFYNLEGHLAGVHAQPIDTQDGAKCDPWAQLAIMHQELRRSTSPGIASVQAFVDMLALGKELLLMRNLPDTSAYKQVLWCQKAWDWIMHQCLAQAVRATCANGEQVGNQDAASIGERTTQLTLDTFHHAGDADVIGAGGLQRLNEVLNVTATAKMHHTSMHVSIVGSQCAIASAQLMRTCLKDVADSVALELASAHSDQDALMQKICYARYAVGGNFSNFYPQIKRTGVSVSKRQCLPIDLRVFRIVLSKSKCIARRITIHHVAHMVFHSIIKYFKKSPSRFSLTHSEPWMASWVIRIRFIAEIGENLDPMHVKSHATLPGHRELTRAIERSIFKNLVVGGCDQIDHAFVANSESLEWRPEKHRLVTVSQPFVCTEGTNLNEVLRMPFVDSHGTWSNSVREIAASLGIMAAQQVVFNESKAVLTFNGGYISPRHLYLLSQTVTHYGFVCPVSRYGLAKSGASPLLRMSFEEGRSVMEQAARHSLVDECSDITSCIILGQKSEIGSGGVQVLPICDVLSEEEVEESEVTSGGQTKPSSVDMFYTIKSIAGRKTAWRNHQKWQRDRPEREKRDAELASLANSYFLGHNEEDCQGGGSKEAGAPQLLDSPAYNLDIPQYTAESPQYNLASPAYDPSSPQFTEGSPQYDPSSPQFTEGSPQYDPYNSYSPQYTTSSPQFTAGSPQYKPASPTMPNFSFLGNDTSGKAPSVNEGSDSDEAESGDDESDDTVDGVDGAESDDFSDDSGDNMWD